MAKRYSDLIQLMRRRNRAWRPQQLCDEMGIQIRELSTLIKKARKAGEPVRCELGQHTDFTHKIWLSEEEVC